MRALYFDCFSGASGDMILGALLDAGAPEEEVRASLQALGLSGWELDIGRVQKAALAATKVTVRSREMDTARRFSDIRALLEKSALAPGVKERALATFGLLARAEAKVHGAPEEEVHFHEVGGIDAIVDIVGSSSALETLAPQEVITSAIATGRGTTSSQHGTIPVPAPAVVELLRGAVLFERGDKELITPTGAAILAAATTRFGVMPPLEITRVGYGAGTRDGEVPNVLRVIEGELLEEDLASERSSGHILIETNLDDMSPELVPFAIERLIEAGAQDAWSSPVLMKKGRQGIQLSVLATEVSRRAVLDVLYRETTTLGARIRRAEKDELERHWETTDVEGHAVRVKVGMSGGEVVSAAPEYEDAAKVARITGLPLKEVYRRALKGFSV